MTGRVNILWRIFDKNAKKLKMKSLERKTSFFLLIYLKTFKKFTFWGPVTSILTFLKFSQKFARVY